MMDNENVKKVAAWCKIQSERVKQQIFSSDYFKKTVKQAFEAVDLDLSDSIDEKELYVAILLLYLQLAKIVRGLVPPSHADVCTILKAADKNGEGVLSLDEFTHVITILLKDIGGRVVIQLVLMFIVIPLLSYFILTVIGFVYKPHWLLVMLVPEAVPLLVLSTLLSILLLPQLLQRFDEYAVGGGGGGGGATGEASSGIDVNKKKEE